MSISDYFPHTSLVRLSNDGLLRLPSANVSDAEASSESEAQLTQTDWAMLHLKFGLIWKIIEAPSPSSLFELKHMITEELCPRLSDMNWFYYQIHGKHGLIETDADLRAYVQGERFQCSFEIQPKPEFAAYFGEESLEAQDLGGPLTQLSEALLDHQLEDVRVSAMELGQLLAPGCLFEDPPSLVGRLKPGQPLGVLAAGGQAGGQNTANIWFDKRLKALDCITMMLEHYEGHPDIVFYGLLLLHLLVESFVDKQEDVHMLEEYKVLARLVGLLNGHKRQHGIVTLVLNLFVNLSKITPNFTSELGRLQGFPLLSNLIAAEQRFPDVAHFVFYLFSQSFPQSYPEFSSYGSLEELRMNLVGFAHDQEVVVQIVGLLDKLMDYDQMEYSFASFGDSLVACFLARNDVFDLPTWVLIFGVLNKIYEKEPQDTLLSTEFVDLIFDKQSQVDEREFHLKSFQILINIGKTHKILDDSLDQTVINSVQRAPEILNHICNYLSWNTHHIDVLELVFKFVETFLKMSPKHAEAAAKRTKIVRATFHFAIKPFGLKEPDLVVNALRVIGQLAHYPSQRHLLTRKLEAAKYLFKIVKHWTRHVIILTTGIWGLANLLVDLQGTSHLLQWCLAKGVPRFIRNAAIQFPDNYRLQVSVAHCLVNMSQSPALCSQMFESFEWDYFVQGLPLARDPELVARLSGCLANCARSSGGLRILRENEPLKEVCLENLWIFRKNTGIQINCLILLLKLYSFEHFSLKMTDPFVVETLRNLDKYVRENPQERQAQELARLVLEDPCLEDNEYSDEEHPAPPEGQSWLDQLWGLLGESPAPGHKCPSKDIRTKILGMTIPASNAPVSMLDWEVSLPSEFEGYLTRLTPVNRSIRLEYVDDPRFSLENSSMEANDGSHSEVLSSIGGF